jgi:aminoglycoside phosphotransferase (APT) family kinase protein
MTPAPASSRPDDDDALLAALRRALQLARSPWADAPLARLHDKGLAHHHVRLGASGVLARVPKHSQMGLGAADNLAYEAACYRRAAASGHVPRVHGLLPVSTALPHGALLVEEIVGRSARLPEDLEAIADAFAAIHTLPLPDGDAATRAPLLDAADPLAALRDEIEAQAAYLDAAALQPAARAAIDATRQRFARECERAARPPRRLIAFDGHPGNFLLRPEDGRAVLVDLEKARYSHPPLDLAHATLYTSTTWDVDSRAELSVAEVVAFYERWQRACDIGPALRPWFVPLRAAMWLWSVTWCAKWRVLSPRAAHAGADGEDWSAEHSSDALVAHVRERVDCYLGVGAVERVCAETEELRRGFK